MQDRIGANRASIFGIRILGLLPPLADAIKMLTKEDFMPARATGRCSRSRRSSRSSSRLVAFASIPFGGPPHDHGPHHRAPSGDAERGHPLRARMLSLGVYGLMRRGWASANNYALLGGQRAAALMISAEIAIGASIMGVVMVYGSLNMQDIARGQGQPLLPQFLAAGPGVGPS
jgi:NADH-quinone oxidoreductase subunit H